MKNITLILMASVGLTMAADARSPINLDILRRDGYGVVPMEHPLENELIVRAMINDRPVHLVLDTGWSGPTNGLCLDQDLASSLKVLTHAADHGYTWTGRKMAMAQGMSKAVIMGNAQLTDVPLYFSNLVGLRDSDKIMGTGSLTPLLRVGARGFITNGFLRATSAIIDLPNLKLYLRPPATGRRAMLGPALSGFGMAEVPLGRAGQHFLVDAEVNGVATKVVVDTGSYLTTLNRNFAIRAKADLFKKGSASDAAGVKTDAWMAGVGNFKIGGVSVYAREIIVADTVLGSSEIAGLLGMDLLGQNWGIIDCGSEKLYLSHVR